MAVTGALRGSLALLLEAGHDPARLLAIAAAVCADDLARIIGPGGAADHLVTLAEALAEHAAGAQPGGGLH